MFGKLMYDSVEKEFLSGQKATSTAIAALFPSFSMYDAFWYKLVPISNIGNLGIPR
jgi:hypothetical protein